MPVSGRAAVSSGARHSHRSSQSEHHHRRDRTKSSQSYTQRPSRDSSAHTPTTQSPSAGTTQTQRHLKSRAHSVPLVPKGQLPGPEDGNMAEDDASDSDPSEDEEIADDPFFQRFDLSQTDRQEEGLRSPTHSQCSSTDTETPLSPRSTQMRARPDSTAAPLGSPLSPNSLKTVRSSQLSC
jgi:hypothetical protein